mmetsp:Transcript_14245/g.48235  ORF Transcript_14245/g.48235 Transcript_14245/m.48235 type:complete len:268 (+) Transcript_14245:266-1069(+)
MAAMAAKPLFLHIHEGVATQSSHTSQSVLHHRRPGVREGPAAAVHALGQLRTHNEQVPGVLPGGPWEQVMRLRRPALGGPQHHRRLGPVHWMVLQFAGHVHRRGRLLRPAGGMDVCPGPEQCFHCRLVLLQRDAMQGSGPRTVRVRQPAPAEREVLEVLLRHAGPALQEQQRALRVEVCARAVEGRAPLVVLVVHVRAVVQKKPRAVRPAPRARVQQRRLPVLVLAIHLRAVREQERRACVRPPIACDHHGRTSPAVGEVHGGAAVQ